MKNELPLVCLAQHGETAWSLSGRHTGLTDLPLTERGEWNARALGERLKGLNSVKVFTSSLQRVLRTGELAGFNIAADVDRDLLEWNYGQYEGLRTAKIHAERPAWQLFRDGCPGGESPDQVGAGRLCCRPGARRPLARARSFGNVELGKVLAQRIVPELESPAERTLGHDGSTNNLIRRYRKLKEAG